MKFLPLSIFIFSDYFTQGRSFSYSLYIFLYMYSPHRQRRFFWRILHGMGVYVFGFFAKGTRELEDLLRKGKMNVYMTIAAR